MQPKPLVEIDLSTGEDRKTPSPQVSKSQQMAQSLVQSKLSASRNSTNPIVGGLSGLGGNFMSLALKDTKDELRVSKKAEQLTRDKLQEC